MFAGVRPAAPLKQALGDLKEDARLWLGQVQQSAHRLKRAMTREQARSPLPARPDPRSDTLPVHEALTAYQAHQHGLLELHHDQFMDQIRQMGGPVDEFLDTLARALIKEEGVAAGETVALADGTRDWLRRLYTGEQLQRATYGFHRAEVCYRSVRLGLDLACSAGQISAAEIEGNRLNRDGVKALFHLRDHYLEQCESLAPLIMARAPLLESASAGEVLGREAVNRTLSSVLNSWRVFDEERYIIEQRLDALPLPPSESALEDSLQMLIDLVELLGSQRQSRERGWHPEEPGRDMHATGISLWLLYTQVATALVYSVVEETCTRELEPATIATSLREGLLELMAGWASQGREVQGRLHPR